MQGTLGTVTFSLQWPILSFGAGLKSFRGFLAIIDGDLFNSFKALSHGLTS